MIGDDWQDALDIWDMADRRAEKARLRADLERIDAGEAPAPADQNIEHPRTPNLVGPRPGSTPDQRNILTSNIMRRPGLPDRILGFGRGEDR